MSLPFTAISQIPVEIISASHHFYLHDDDITGLSILKFVLRCDDESEIICSDTLPTNGTPFNDRVLCTSKMKGDYFYFTKQYKYQDLIKSYTDSTLIYLPFRYFGNPQSPCQFDSLWVANISSNLAKLNEPKIYKNYTHNIIRVYYEHLDSIESYRLELKNNACYLNAKEGKFEGDSIILSSGVEAKSTEKLFSKITKQLVRGEFFSDNYIIRAYPMNFLIEYSVDGDYHFINGNYDEFKYHRKNKKIIKVLDWLRRNAAE